MADWADRRQHYIELGMRDAQTDDDLIARRLVKGLGFANADKTLYRLERRLLGATYGTLPLWERAWQVVRILLVDKHNERQHPLAYAHQVWEPETRSVKNSEEVIARFEEWFKGSEGAPPIPLMFTRIQGTADSRTYTLWPTAQIVSLKPPFSVMAFDAVGLRLVAQETTLFVSQFGPFDVEVTDAMCAEP